MRNVLFAGLILASSVLAIEATDATLGFLGADRSIGSVWQANPVADTLLWVRSR